MSGSSGLLVALQPGPEIQFAAKEQDSGAATRVKRGRVGRLVQAGGFHPNGEYNGLQVEGPNCLGRHRRGWAWPS